MSILVVSLIESNFNIKWSVLKQPWLILLFLSSIGLPKYAQGGGGGGKICLKKALKKVQKVIGLKIVISSKNLLIYTFPILTNCLRQGCQSLVAACLHVFKHWIPKILISTNKWSADQEQPYAAWNTQHLYIWKKLSLLHLPWIINS